MRVGNCRQPGLQVLGTSLPLAPAPGRSPPRHLVSRTPALRGPPQPSQALCYQLPSEIPPLGSPVVDGGGLSQGRALRELLGVLGTRERCGQGSGLPPCQAGVQRALLPRPAW